MTQLGKLDEVKQTAGSIQKNATKIESACTGIRLLADELATQTEAAADSPDTPWAGAVAYGLYG